MFETWDIEQVEIHDTILRKELDELVARKKEICVRLEALKRRRYALVGREEED